MSTNTRLILPANVNGRFVLIGDRRHGVADDVEALLNCETKHHLLLEAAFANYLLAHTERDRTTNAQPAFLVVNFYFSIFARGFRLCCGAIGKTFYRLYKDPMKTLTITNAKKNLSQWLAAAARGQDIGIIYGADIIALRKVEVESTDYAQREYGVTPEQVAALEEATDKRYRRLIRSGKLVTISTDQLRKMLE